MAERKYSKKLMKEICKHVASGLSYKDSAFLAGIVESTLYRWLDPEDKNNPLTPKEVKEFSEALKVAEAKQKQSLLKELRKHGKKNWLPIAWFLERKWPDEFGRKDASRSSPDEPLFAAPQTKREADLAARLLTKYHDLKQRKGAEPSPTDIPTT